MIAYNTIFCISGGVVLSLVMVLIVALRYIAYRENLALAEKGLLPQKNHNAKDTLRWGILISAVGLALSLGLYPVGLSFDMEYPLGFGPWMLIGLVPLFFGLALILVYVLTKEKN
jgi:hypothetical protein